MPTYQIYVFALADLRVVSRRQGYNHNASLLVCPTCTQLRLENAAVLALILLPFWGGFLFFFCARRCPLKCVQGRADSRMVISSRNCQAVNPQFAFGFFGSVRYGTGKETGKTQMKRLR
ncbi:hypothetical protein B0H12DRAFT_1084286 [Mycena haematopus]|nr:hypothetical protein B0H12DRAFT_1084286 [Mycena haematopus]